MHPPTADELGPISVGEPIAFIADLQRAGRTHARVELDVDPALPPAVGVLVTWSTRSSTSSSL